MEEKNGAGLDGSGSRRGASEVAVSLFRDKTDMTINSVTTVANSSNAGFWGRPFCFWDGVYGFTFSCCFWCCWCCCGCRRASGLPSTERSDAVMSIMVVIAVVRCRQKIGVVEIRAKERLQEMNRRRYLLTLAAQTGSVSRSLTTYIPEHAIPPKKL